MLGNSKNNTGQSKKSGKLLVLEAYFTQVKEKFHKTHTQASKWLSEAAIDLDQLRTNSKQFFAATALVSGIAMHQPVDVLLSQQLQAMESQHEMSHKDAESLLVVSKEEHESIMQKMIEYVSRAPGHLANEDELYLEQQLTDMLGFQITAQVDGNRLNHSIGVMGGEQHLHRFPGDSLSQHDAFLEAGIAPARGAFGWFTENGVLTQKAIDREKYYFAVQTLYLPDWNTRHPVLKPWYSFRKMIAINPAEQVAVVGVVGDAGPAQWVNKQFGGSPEVIREAKIWSPKSKGKVLLFFVDDPDDTIPLGVIDLSTQALFEDLESTNAR